MSTAHDGPRNYAPVANRQGAGPLNFSGTVYTGLKAPPIDLDVDGVVEMAPVPGYESLRKVLDAAYDQAARGKGRERHARQNEGFEQQFIMRGAEIFGIDGLFFQAMKKAEESKRLPHAAAQKEVLGAIVYMAAAYIFNERRQANSAHGN